MIYLKHRHLSDILQFHCLVSDIYLVCVISCVLFTDGVMINNAQVTMTDIPVSNGVVHVIDTVLVPPV